MGKVSTQTPTIFGIGDGTTKSFSVGGTGEVVDSMNVKSIYRADANGNNLLYQNVGPLAPGSYPQYPQGINNAICNRSTPATYIDQNGILQTAAPNVPRYQNGSLLVEAAATNYIAATNYSGGAPWYAFNTSLLANAIDGPDGTRTAVQATITAIGNQNFEVYAAAPLGSLSAVGTIFLMAGTTDSACPQLYQDGVGNPGNLTVSILQGPGYVYPGGVEGAEIRGLSTSVWTRVAVSTTSLISANNITQVYVKPNLSNGVIGQSLYAWGMQLEAGVNPSSYIPTTTGPATRAADQIVISDYTVS